MFKKRWYGTLNKIPWHWSEFYRCSELLCSSLSLPYQKKIGQVKDKWVMSGQEQMEYVWDSLFQKSVCINQRYVTDSVIFARIWTMWWKFKATPSKSITENAFYDMHNCKLNPQDIIEARGLIGLKKWIGYIYENMHSYIRSDETVYFERMWNLTLHSFMQQAAC